MTVPILIAYQVGQKTGNHTVIKEVKSPISEFTKISGSEIAQWKGEIAAIEELPCQGDIETERAVTILTFQPLVFRL